MENEQLPEKTMVCNNEMLGYLRACSKWCKFLAIIAFIGTGLILLIGLILLAAGPLLSALTKTGFPFWLLGFVYIAIGVVNFFPAYYMYRFAVLTGESIPARDEPALTEGIGYMKKLYKFNGILTIILLSIYLMACVIVIPVMLALR